MKNTKKFFVSLLTCSSIFFSLEHVSAITNELKKEPEVIIDQKSIVSIEEIKQLLPTQINLNLKDTDLFQQEDIPYDSILYEKSNEIIDNTLRTHVEFVKETITNNNYTYEQENFIVNGIKMYYEINVKNLHTFVVTVYERKAPDFYHCISEEDCQEKDIEKTVQFRKEISIVYANQNLFDKNEEEYVKKAIQNFDFIKISSDFNLDYE